MSRAAYEFGEFRLEPDERRLLHGGEDTGLAPRLLDVLEILVRSAGQVVDRNTLIDAVWRDVFVTESNLTQSIWLLRKTLGDDGETYIQTVRKTGYRFVAPVHEVAIEATGPSVIVTAEPGRSRVGGWRRAATRTALAIVVVAAIVALVTTARKHSSDLSQDGDLRPAVAVLATRDLSGGGDTAWLATAIAEMVTAELAASPELRVIPQDRIWELSRGANVIPGASPTPQQLAWLGARIGGGYAVVGSYLVLDAAPSQSVRIDLQLRRLGDGGIEGAASASGSLDDLFGVVSELGADARRALRVAPATNEPAALARASVPRAPEVARAYADGLAKLREHASLQAVRLFEQVIELEPTFAPARSALAQTWSTLGYDRRAVEQARLAVELAGSLPAREHRLAEARLAEYRKEWPRAIAIHRELFEADPDDLEQGLRLMKAQLDAADPAGATVTIAALRGLPFPLATDLRIDLGEAGVAAQRSEYRRQAEVAGRTADRATDLGLEELAARARNFEIEARFRLGEMAEALTQARELARRIEHLGDRRTFAAVLNLEGSILRLQDDYPGARDAFERALSVLDAIGHRQGAAVVRGNLAVLESDTGEVEKSVELYRDAIADLEAVGDRFNTAIMRMNLGATLGDLGRIGDGEAEVRIALGHANEVGNRKLLAWGHSLLAGEAYLTLNLELAQLHTEEAIALARQAEDREELLANLKRLGWISLEMGDVAAATAAAKEARTVTEGLETESARAPVLELEAALRVVADDLEPAAELLREASELIVSDLPADRAMSHEQLAQVLLEQGDIAQAEVEAREATAGYVEAGFAGSAATRALTARCLLATGRTSAAAAELEPVTRSALAAEDRTIAVAVAQAAALIAAHNGDFGRARELASAALAEATSHHHVWLRLDLLLTAAEIDRLAGRSDAVRSNLEAALREAEQVGFALHARKARAAIARLDAHDPPSRGSNTQ